jgi:uncharacterized membrane protein YgdD (TMEM256/DUF423 family)
MKITFTSLVILAAFAAAPIASQASDKETQTPKCYRQNQHQVALFVSGRGIAQTPAPRIESVTHAQVGQGVGVTFFTGNR